MNSPSSKKVRGRTVANYDQGVSWIAWNDDPGAREALQVNSVAGYISTLLLADLFGVKPETVARAVVKYRKEHGCCG